MPGAHRCASVSLDRGVSTGPKMLGIDLVAPTFFCFTVAYFLGNGSLPA